MRQTSINAFFLTLLVGTLALAAAVVFLLDRNGRLENQRDDLAEQRAMAEATREELTNDLAVREGQVTTLETAAAELESVVGSQQDQIETLEVQAENTPEPPPIEVFIFAPLDGETVKPLEGVELFVAARTERGLASIQISIYEATSGRKDLGPFPAEDEAYTVRTLWEPPAEGQYVIEATANASDGRSSTPVIITINAAFESDEERNEVLGQRLVDETMALRLPEEAPIFPPPNLSSQPAEDLHQLMLAGGPGARPPADEALVLQAFGFLPETASLDNYLAQVANRPLSAYYDPGTGVVTVFEPGDSLRLDEPFDRWVQVHDLTHALQEQRFLLSELDFANLETDARAARRALVEGEANLLQFLYLQDEGLDPTARQAVLDGLGAAGLGVLVDLPAYLREQFEFAYQAGFNFADALYGQPEQMAALDNAWARPPVSTEQILHPELYLLEDTPLAVSLAPLAGVLGEGWRLAAEDTFGEWHLRQYLGQQLTAEELDLAALGWGGGRFVVYQQEADETLVMALRLAWDNPTTDNGEFATAYGRFLGRLFLGTEAREESDGARCWEADAVSYVVCLYTLDDQSLAIRAPDVATVALVAAAQNSVTVRR